MDEQLKISFQSARDTTKQFITLATGIIALEITFLTDVVKALDNGVKLYVQLSWLSFLLSILFGIWTLMALTGTIAKRKNEKLPNIYGSNVKLPSILQIVTFLAGLSLTVIFGFKAY